MTSSFDEQDSVLCSESRDSPSGIRRMANGKWQMASVCHLSSAIRYLPSAIRHLPSVIRESPFTGAPPLTTRTNGDNIRTED
jgi:hypothetical protein